MKDRPRYMKGKIMNHAQIRLSRINQENQQRLI
jgi:hypothetical protein